MGWIFSVGMILVAARALGVTEGSCIGGNDRVATGIDVDDTDSSIGMG